nr:copia protein [Tanacetum cinerariifolium]
MNQNYFEPNYFGFDQPQQYSIDHQEDLNQQQINNVIEDKMEESHNELLNMDPEDFLVMRNEDLSTIPEKESDEFIKSSVEDLVLIPSESENTSESDSEWILPLCDDFSPINIFEEKSVTFSNPLFNSNDDFTSSDDESLSDEDVLENIESKDSYDSNLDELDLLVTPLFDDNKDECFDPGGDVVKINDFEDGYYDSEGDILYLESLLSDDTTHNLPPKVFLDRDLKSLIDAPIDNLMSEDKVFDPGICVKFFLQHMKVEESLNVTFDKTHPPSKTSPLVDDELDEDKATKITEKKNLENDIADETLEIDEIVNIKESRNHPLENVIGNLNQRTLRNKLEENSVVSRNKARLVAQGFINEEVYMAQPPGFIDFEKPDHDYKLKKALYGLKQALWYDRLKAFLIKYEYKMGMVDNTLFTKKKISKLIIVQIYVDDIIFGSACQDMCDEFAKIMHDEFEMSMMGELNFFLGLQIKQMEDDIFLNQSKYIKEMLKKFGLEDSKPMKTLMSSDTKLTKDEECESVDSTKYQGMIGWQSQGQSLVNHACKAINDQDQMLGGLTKIEGPRLVARGALLEPKSFVHLL